MSQGKWIVDMPQDMEAGQKGDLQYASLSEVFDRVQEPSDSALYREYTKYVENALQQQKHRSFGALILEPVILGAGGMIFASVPVTHKTAN
jgi:bifunctional dethiobiotin synthetase / adenosylmethionine---8-amino-7-oxononanoate aminotransferase